MTINQKFREDVWLQWITDVMVLLPTDSMYLNSERGIEVTKLCIDNARRDFSWRRADVDTFWIDIQMYVKYQLSDEDIAFIEKQQPGVDNYAKHSKERKAYAEMVRGIEKLRKISLEEEDELA